jgi:hypothetical protein
MIQKRIHFEACKIDVRYIYNNSGILENNTNELQLAFNLLNKRITKLSFTIRKLDKGKPLERVGRKATGLNPAKHGIR